MHTGSFTFVRPSIGSWVVYGLGTENQDLPGFVTLNPGGLGGAALYGSAFLPASYQGTPITIAKGQAPIENIRNTKLSAEKQRKQIDFVQEMNREMLAGARKDNELEGLISSYELAFRMQASVPKVMDVKGESVATLEAYGFNDAETRAFGTQCLLARRMAEAGVRFIELNMNGWDQHSQLKSKIQSNAAAIDKPIAALIADLKQRGLFNDTLLVWGGEFGRSAHEQGPGGDGRQHNNRGDCPTCRRSASLRNGSRTPSGYGFDRKLIGVTPSTLESHAVVCSSPLAPNPPALVVPHRGA
jgi:hypothetical protein